MVTPLHEANLCRPARLWDVLIAGAGPAGCTAALFAALAGRKVLLTEKCAVGGGMLHAPEIRNWPGEPVPVDGIALGERMRKQVLAAGAVLRYGEITNVTIPPDPDTAPITVLLSSAPAQDGTRCHRELQTRTLILATGNSPLPAGICPAGTIGTSDTCRTSIPHVYAIGACRNPECRRIIAACADGQKAAEEIRD